MEIQEIPPATTIEPTTPYTFGEPPRIVNIVGTIEKEQHITLGTPAHRLAIADDGSQWFLKTTAGVISPVQSIDMSMRGSQLDRAAFAWEINHAREFVQTEEAAWRLADFLEAPMAETRAIEYRTIEDYVMDRYGALQDNLIFDTPRELFAWVEAQRLDEFGRIPWSAARFIDGVIDRTHRSWFSEASLDMDSIQQDLARIAILNFILLNHHGEGTQLIEIPGNRVHAMDVQLLPHKSMFHEVISPEILLHYVLERRIGVFESDRQTIQAQLEGIGKGLGDETFIRANKLDTEALMAITSKLPQGEITPIEEEILTAAHAAEEIFRFLARPDHRELVLDALTSGAPIDKSNEARGILLEQFRQEHTKKIGSR